MRAAWHRHTAWVPMTAAEWRFVQTLARQDATTTPNLLRRAIKAYAAQGQVRVPEGLLTERTTHDRKVGYRR